MSPSADGRLLVHVSVGPRGDVLSALARAVGARVRPLPVHGAQVTLALDADRISVSATTVDDGVVVAFDVSSA
jgi:hypothetical protein